MVFTKRHVLDRVCWVEYAGTYEERFRPRTTISQTQKDRSTEMERHIKIEGAHGDGKAQRQRDRMRQRDRYRNSHNDKQIMTRTNLLTD